MHVFPTRDLSSTQAYKLISAAVTPRPIAWVSTLAETGAVNLAPFSSYTFVSYTPPKVLISIGPGTDVLKDTLSNIVRRREFCVSAVTLELLDPMVQSSFAFGSDESEAELLGIPLQVGRLLTTPFVAAAPLAMECRLDRIVDVDDDDAHRLVIGTIEAFHVDDAIWHGNRIDPTRYRTLGRIGGPLYVTRGEIVEAPAPRRPESTALG
jgi:flavin reductase (DIM6/NTAB) family NADH-FMN oxidoreductase RutF